MLVRRGRREDSCRALPLCREAEEDRSSSLRGHVGFIWPERLDRRFSGGDHDRVRVGVARFGRSGPQDDQGLPPRTVRTAGMQQAGGRAMLRGESGTVISAHASPSPSLLSCCRTAPAGGQGVCRTMTGTPKAYGTSCARRGVVRVSLRDPAGGRPLVCRSRWRRVKRCRLCCCCGGRPSRRVEDLARLPTNVLNAPIFAIEGNYSLCQ